MAMLHVRFRSGETDEWELDDRMDLAELFRMLAKSGPTSNCSFGVRARTPTTAYDYGMVGLRMVEVASWHIDGMLEDAGLIGPWGEAQEIPPE